MNKRLKTLTAVMAASLIGTASLPFTIPSAHAAAPAAASISATPSPSAASLLQELEAAMKDLLGMGIVHGYEDQSLRAVNRITRAELAKMVVKTFDLDGKVQTPPSLSDVSADAWYADYASEVVGLGIMAAPNGQFNPNGTVTDDELVQIVAKALGRDVLSVKSWLDRHFSVSDNASRGEAAYLLRTAHKAIPSEQAKIKSVTAQNAITLIVTFDKPLTAANEAFDKAKADFVFNDGLSLTNMPRLKTGSIATYIVPTSVQKTGTNYTLTYKGERAGSFLGSGTKLEMTKATQVTNDTFELESLKANGVVDYGYVISAYSAGRGSNAFILDDRNQADGREYQIISSMQARSVTIAAEGGQPIVARYVPFTQSTDGRQEPKFRLPEGTVLTPGVKYTVTSDWANIANASFVAASVAPLEVVKAEATSDTSITVTLAQDPGDELFSGRSVLLTAPNGDKLTATYKYSSRKGAVGVFDLPANTKLAAGTTYTVTPVGAWATAGQVAFTTN